MTRREKEKLSKDAHQLQAQIDDLVYRRNELLRAGEKADTVKTKRDCWKACHEFEIRIEHLSRKLRSVQTRLNPPAEPKLLWEFTNERK